MRTSFTSWASVPLFVNVTVTRPAGSDSTPAVSKTNVSGAGSAAVTLIFDDVPPGAALQSVSQLLDDYAEGSWFLLLPGEGLLSAAHAANASTATIAVTTFSIDFDMASGSSRRCPRIHHSGGGRHGGDEGERVVDHRVGIGGRHTGDGVSRKHELV